MSDVITSLRQVIQDLVAPDMKAANVKLDGLQKQMDLQYDALRKQVDFQYDTLMKTIDAFRAEMRSEFVSLNAKNQMEVMRQTSPLSERIAVMESRGK